MISLFRIFSPSAFSFRNDRCCTDLVDKSALAPEKLPGHFNQAVQIFHAVQKKTRVGVFLTCAGAAIPAGCN